VLNYTAASDQQSIKPKTIHINRQANNSCRQIKTKIEVKSFYFQITST